MYKEQIATLEHAITQADPRFKTEKGLQKITSQTIATGLRDNELYIDYGKTNDGYYLFTIDMAFLMLRHRIQCCNQVWCLQARM